MSDRSERAPRRRRSPEAARQEILDAATRRFAARGFDAVSLHDIARAVGVSHALVLHYFESFDGVVRAVIGARNAAVARGCWRASPTTTRRWPRARCWPRCSRRCASRPTVASSPGRCSRAAR
ncbi:MAG: helix-turn-helix domain-containing protein [Polyangiales bacterium]